MHHDSTVMKVDSKHSPRGDMGQKYLASGKQVSMRLWERLSEKDVAEFEREYETVGFVIDGSAELHLEGQIIKLERGDSWLVPKGAAHAYRNLNNFTAVEATAPPAQMYSRDSTE